MALGPQQYQPLAHLHLRNNHGEDAHPQRNGEIHSLFHLCRQERQHVVHHRPGTGAYHHRRQPFQLQQIPVKHTERIPLQHPRTLCPPRREHGGRHRPRPHQVQSPVARRRHRARQPVAGTCYHAATHQRSHTATLSRRCPR